ncbi:MAG TPA: penicillin-binding transpeptidase domain-containing protein [Tepidisphaeraceae bacterium]|jgi:penicillin-binding protein 2|nr:penicillin-binding transpeptidase domain-containing protein [Tepidisphaeraceae bacterium]
MFERRLKIFLSVLFVVTFVLIARAMQLQVIQRHEYRREAELAMTNEELTETIRGQIKDYRGRPIAMDMPCINACVDYRAITQEPDPLWVHKMAVSRAVRRDDYTLAGVDRRREIIADEEKLATTRIAVMWAKLARLAEKSPGSLDDSEDARIDPGAQIDQIRQRIIRSVESRRRYLWYARYNDAVKDFQNQPKPSWYRRFLNDTQTQIPELDDFDVDMKEKVSAHVILQDISPEVQNELGKNLEDYPGLSLQPGLRRVYPYKAAACHVIGHLSNVNREDVENSAEDDELRRYRANDKIGRTGLEALFEPLLRGTRGQVRRISGEEKPVAVTEAQPGKDVVTTIDIDLQETVQDLFRHVKVDPDDETVTVPLHGSAVVIDVASGEVRCMASYPDYDANGYFDNYAILSQDKLNQPLMNRATQYPLTPGSTMKPIVGIGAITQGVLGAHETIECTGYLVLGKRKFTRSYRCWTMQRYGAAGLGSHHMIPYAHPQPGEEGTQPGFLTFSDALERSCNVFFETTADRLKIEGLSYWMKRFGLGEPTGIGIAESGGMVPSDFHGSQRDGAAWLAGIGQGPVATTTIQMANVAATIARNGVWVRPTLVAGGVKVPRKPTTQPTPWLDRPDREDLHLSREAIAAAHDGMFRVVNHLAGTGTQAKRADVKVAGKTGTAQAPPFLIARIDPVTGQVMKDERGRVVKEPLAISTKEHPNPLAPWYRGTGKSGVDLSHAWFIGYAPADNPKLAIAVMVEYGGSGGATAGVLANDILGACIEHGYLPHNTGSSIAQNP